MNATVSAKPLSAHTPKHLDGSQMRGIDYVTDARGRKKAVQIDLRKHGDLWEDFHDAMVVHSRRNEPRVSFESVMERHRKRARTGRAKYPRKNRN